MGTTGKVRQNKVFIPLILFLVPQVSKARLLSKIITVNGLWSNPRGLLPPTSLYPQGSDRHMLLECPLSSFFLLLIPPCPPLLPLRIGGGKAECCPWEMEVENQWVLSCSADLQRNCGHSLTSWLQEPVFKSLSPLHAWQQLSDWLPSANKAFCSMHALYSCGSAHRTADPAGGRMEILKQKNPIATSSWGFGSWGSQAVPLPYCIYWNWRRHRRNRIGRDFWILWDSLQRGTTTELHFMRAKCTPQPHMWCKPFFHREREISLLTPPQLWCHNPDTKEKWAFSPVFNLENSAACPALWMQVFPFPSPFLVWCLNNHL